MTTNNPLFWLLLQYRQIRFLLFKGYIKLVLRLALDTFFRKLINFGHIPITAAASFRVILNAIGGYYF